MYQIGIIFRTCNSPLQLRRALQNLLEQTLTSWEAIVINDGGMIEAVDQLTFELTIPKTCQLRVLHLEQTKGSAFCYNKGLSLMSATEFCLFREDCDTWDAEFLSSTTEYLRSHKNEFIQAVHPLYYEVTDKSSVTSMRSSKKKPGRDMGHIQASTIVDADPLLSSAMVYTREAVAAIGPFDESLRMFSDWDYHMKFLLRYSVDMLRERLAYKHTQHIEVDEVSQLKQQQTEAFSADLLRKRWLQLDEEALPKAAEVIRRAHSILQRHQEAPKKKNRGFFSFFKH